MMAATIQQRLSALEASDGGGDGCPRCRGMLLTVGDALTGEVLRASWNGEDLHPEELAERETEVRCPACGRDMSADENPVIMLGGAEASRRRSL